MGITLPTLPPRWYQLALYKAYWSGVRNMIVSWPRRHGKDMISSQILLTEATRFVDNYWYLYPSRAHADRVVWQKRGEMMVNGEKRSGKVIDMLFPPEIVARKREKDLSIELKNGSLIMFGGTDDGSFVGQGGRGYLLAEMSLHKNDVTSYIAPIQEESNAFLLMQGTMRGKQNHLYRMYEANKNREGWFSEWLLPEMTKMYYWKGDDIQLNPELEGKISPYTGRPYTNIQDIVDSGKSSYALARQEFLNEAILETDSGYYAYEYQKAKKEGRNVSAKYNPNLPVFTFWDLGKGSAQKSTDAMSIWFAQFPDEDLPDPNRIHLIDYHESRGKDWAFYARTLNSKGYMYGGHFAPWDINKGMAGLDGNNHQWAKQSGIDFTTVKRRGYNIMEAIEICRRRWTGLEFSEGVSDAVDMLVSYHEKVDKQGVGMGVAEHDNASNCADAYRTMVEALERGIVLDKRVNDRFDWDSFTSEGYFD